MPIIGKGNIASVIHDRDNVIFFASGNSDSNCTDTREFQREIALLHDQDYSKHLVYFSSLSIYRSNNDYNRHKKLMEDTVKRNFKSYTIIRVEVIAWGRNPTTIHNVFRTKLAQGEHIEVQNTFRYIVRKDEFLYWLSLIPVGEKNEMNITGQRHTIYEILQMVKKGEL